MLPLLLACSGDPEPAATSAAGAPAAPPDIVLVVIDTLRADHLSSYGYGRETTPHIDALAADGLRFSRAYAQSSWTLPSFTSLLTGQYAHEHRIGRAALDPSKFGRLAPEVTTLPELLQQSGYRTAAVMNNTFLAPEFGLQQGFGQQYRWQGASNSAHRSAAATVAEGLAWLGESEQPAFILVHMMEPHLDYAPPDAVRGTFAPREGLPVPAPFSAEAFSAALNAGTAKVDDVTVGAIKALYDEEIRAADDAVGALAAGLERRGRPTLIAVTADHGEEFFEHGGFEHGHTLLGELTRVPLVLRGPGIEEGEVRTVVEHVDLYATLLAVAGVAPPAGARGQDLRQIAAGGAYTGARYAISENILYGPPQLSLVGDAHRIVIDQTDGSGQLWVVDEDGLEHRAEPASAQQIAQPLIAQLTAIRGHLQPITEVPVPADIPGPAIFDQLRSLGYLEEEPQLPATPASP